MSREEILVRLKEYKDSACRQYGIRRLGVFGSVAREEASAQSDLDIVIEMEIPDLFLMGNIQQDLEERFGVPIDLVRIRDNMNPFLKDRIVREAVFI